MSVFTLVAVHIKLSQGVPSFRIGIPCAQIKQGRLRSGRNVKLWHYRVSMSYCYARETSRLSQTFDRALTSPQKDCAWLTGLIVSMQDTEALLFRNDAATTKNG